jgi:uncharacterized protein
VDYAHIAIKIGLVATLVLSGGCAPKDTGMNQLPELSANVKKQLMFTCAVEKDRIPSRVIEADQLYAHARWLIKNNVLKQDTAVYPAVER